jgi:hypothetical protein
MEQLNMRAARLGNPGGFGERRQRLGAGVLDRNENTANGAHVMPFRQSVRQASTMESSYEDLRTLICKDSASFNIRTLLAKMTPYMRCTP